jgi:hypothetical protein
VDVYALFMSIDVVDLLGRRIFTSTDVLLLNFSNIVVRVFSNFLNEHYGIIGHYLPFFYCGLYSGLLRCCSLGDEPDLVTTIDYFLCFAAAADCGRSSS